MFNLLQSTFQQNETLHQEIKDLQTQNSVLVNHILDVKKYLRIQRQVPPQVLLQQPVILNDALGRIAPFHLEFIDSVEAFLAVLQIRFEHVGRPKISRLEFDLRDTANQKVIGLRKSWKGVFRVRFLRSLLEVSRVSTRTDGQQAGQHIDMSMLFALSHDQTSCPGCLYEEQTPFEEGETVQW